MVTVTAVGGSPGPSSRGAVPYTEVHRFVRRFLEPAQDVLIVALAVALLATMIRTLIVLAQHAIAPAVPARMVLGETMFMLVLVELLRLLVIYLRDHHVSVDVMVEATLVAALREVSVHGVIDLPTTQLLALAGFTLALGLILRFGDLRTSQQVRRRRRPRFGHRRPGRFAERELRPPAPH
jgi:uncharacterized membrane protein (DUF373 family)